MTNSQEQAIVQRWFNDLWTHGNLDLLDELVADDFTAHPPQDFSLQRGREEFRRTLQWYHQTFVDPAWRIDDMISAGDKIVVRCTGWATYVGGWLDIPGHGQRVRECSILIFRIADGKIKELWFEVSDLDVVHQLGATVTAGASKSQ